jgi:hypothetical protein
MEAQEGELNQRALEVERLRQVLIQKQEGLFDAQEQIRFCTRQLASRGKKFQERAHRQHSLTKQQTAALLKEHDEQLTKQEKKLDGEVARWLRKQKKKAGLGSTAKKRKPKAKRSIANTRPAKNGALGLGMQ